MPINTIRINEHNGVRYIDLLNINLGRNGMEMITYELQDLYDIHEANRQSIIDFIHDCGLEQHINIDPEAMGFFAYHNVDVYNL
jgi:hypothetical protein